LINTGGILKGKGIERNALSLFYAGIFGNKTGVNRTDYDPLECKVTELMFLIPIIT